MGQTYYEESREFMESDTVYYNKELSEAIFPFFKWALIVMTFGRPILMALSYKYVWVTKTYFTYNVLFLAIWSTLPGDYGIY